MDGLAVGRMVHYVDGSDIHRAAVIHEVQSSGGFVGLTVFTPDGPRLVSGCNYDPTFSACTWHWIERA